MGAQIAAFIGVLALGGGAAAWLPVFTDLGVSETQHAVMLGLAPALAAFLWWVW